MRLREDVEASLEGVEIVIHLAGLVGNPACSWNKSVAWDFNVGGTRMLLNCIASRGALVKSFLFASSCSVYGYGDDVFKEDSALNPVDYYAQTKLQSERDIQRASLSCRVAIMRFATVFGLSKRMRFDLAVNAMTRDAVREGVVLVHGGSQQRPFINCMDIGGAILCILNNVKANGPVEIYNVGDNRLNYSLAEVGKAVAETVPGARLSVEEGSYDKRSYFVSFDKLSRLGFQSSISLEEGVAAIRRALDEQSTCSFNSYIYSNYEVARRVIIKGGINE